MNSGLVDGYILNVDDKLVSVSETLEKAQEVAKDYMSNKSSLRILHSPASITPTRNWNYDYDIAQWVELQRG